MVTVAEALQRRVEETVRHNRHFTPVGSGEKEASRIQASASLRQFSCVKLRMNGAREHSFRGRFRRFISVVGWPGFHGEQSGRPFFDFGGY